MNKVKCFIIFTSILFGLLSSIFAKKIDENTAKTVGVNFLSKKINTKSTQNFSELKLVHTATNSNFYIFNSENGFVIISGDDNAIPILGYSDNGKFDPNNIPPNAKEWLQNYNDQINQIIKQGLKSTPSISSEWNEYITGNITSVKGTSVSPLITTSWGQSPNYNSLCPSGSLTGCVATAMAQIMKYWNAPIQGIGTHSYVSNTHQYQLSAYYYNAYYDWINMPNQIFSTNNAIATLMYHCGISVNMDYRTAAEGGSGAFSDSVVSAFKTHFQYNNVSIVDKTNYDEIGWVNLLKSELDAKRPIYYSGRGVNGGHAFVCDGYNIQNQFHFNWGWDGNFNGYFTIGSLNPYSFSFNIGNRAIIGIAPEPCSIAQINLPTSKFNPASKWVAGWDVNNGWNTLGFLRCIADVNGDGKGDIVGFGQDGVYVALSTGTLFGSQQKWNTGWGANQGWGASYYHRCIADVNGDGKGDIVGFGQDGVYVALSTGVSFDSQQKWNTGWGANQGWGASSYLRCIADVNGDGKGDIVGFGQDGVYVALSTGTTFGTQQKWNTGWGVNQGWSALNFQRCIADVNGDGKGDIVGFNNNGTYVALSTGSTFDNQQLWNTGWGTDQGWGTSSTIRRLGDFNGDGKDDIIGFTDLVYTSNSNGSSFLESAFATEAFKNCWGWDNSNFYRCVSDVNGDGKTDIVGFGQDGVYVSTSKSTKIITTKNSTSQPSSIIDFLSENEELFVSPNPSDGKFMIKTNLKNSIINIYNTTGIKVSSINIKDESEIEIDLSNKAKGIYIINITDGLKSYNAKIITR